MDLRMCTCTKCSFYGHIHSSNVGGQTEFWCPVKCLVAKNVFFAGSIRPLSVELVFFAISVVLYQAANQKTVSFGLLKVAEIV